MHFHNKGCCLWSFPNAHWKSTQPSDSKHITMHTYDKIECILPKQPQHYHQSHTFIFKMTVIFFLWDRGLCPLFLTMGKLETVAEVTLYGFQNKMTSAGLSSGRLLLKPSHHFKRKPKQPMEAHAKRTSAPSWSQQLVSRHVWASRK